MREELPEEYKDRIPDLDSVIRVATTAVEDIVCPTQPAD